MKHLRLALLLSTLLGGGLGLWTRAAEPPAWLLRPQAAVDSEGVFLSQVVEVTPPQALPQVRLADAPPFGQAATLTRMQVLEVVRKAAPDLISSTWQGAERVRITRRSRTLTEADLKEQLTAVLQRDYVKDKGELELRLTRPWLPMLVPDESLTLKILDLPTTGITANCIVRFELNTQRERIGAWQAPVQARLWREVWVARTPVKSGTPFVEADLTRERRDVINLREALLPEHPPAAALEMADTLAAGAPVSSRSVRLRPIVHRGQVVDAQLLDGAMTISLKAEVLENGVPGQVVRARNLQTKREFKGKVHDDQRLQILL
jgi:flagellar basal body P-ring formation protein FlgA